MWHNLAAWAGGRRLRRRSSSIHPYTHVSMYSLAFKKKSEKLPEYFHTGQPRCIVKDVHRLCDEPVRLQDAVSPDASARV